MPSKNLLKKTTHTAPDVGTPGLIVDIKTLTAGTDNPDYYRGKVVVLVDERAVSLSEFTVMALQTAPDSTVIGSRTAGADGNISYFTLPGYVADIKQGRDAVLEEAPNVVRQHVGVQLCHEA